MTQHEPRFDGDGGNLDQPCSVDCVVNIYAANDFTRSYGRSKDDHVAIEHAQCLIDRLQAAAVQSDLVVLEGAGHGFKVPDAGTAERAIFEFFDARLRAKRACRPAGESRPLQIAGCHPPEECFRSFVTTTAFAAS